MHVPDSIIVGPSRATIPRAQQDNDRLPPRMEVPDSIRLGMEDIIFLIHYLLFVLRCTWQYRNQLSSKS